MRNLFCTIISLLLIHTIPFAQFQFNTAFNIQKKSKNTLHSLDTIKANLDLLEEMVLQELNEIRVINNLEKFRQIDILDLPAEDQAGFMARTDELLEIQSGRRKLPEDRMRLYGGSLKSTELNMQLEFDYNRKQFSWEKIAENIVRRFTVLKGYKDVILSPAYFFIGIGIHANNKFNNLYITVVCGNYLSFNKGAALREEAHIPHSAGFFSNNIKLSYGYTKGNDAECKPFNKMHDLQQIQDGLIVNENKVYLKLPNSRILKRTLNTPGINLAVDVIPKSLYTCDTVNLIDYNRPNRGILMKGLSLNQIENRNIYKSFKDSVYSKIGRLKYIQDLSGPRFIQEDVELNLVMIYNDKICKIMAPVYRLESKKSIFSSGLIVDTSLNETPEKFQKDLFSDIDKLIFNIPFKKNKYDYKRADIEPLINALNEPRFNVESVDIMAYSSIEGSELNNEFLQQARAQSILKVFKKLYSDSIVYNISTNDSWEQFKLDIKGSVYDTILFFNKQLALQYIKEHKLYSSLEPIFKKHRYAHVVLNVKYDTTVTSMSLLAFKKLNNYLKLNDVYNALQTMKFIAAMVLNQEYTVENNFELKIPEAKEYAILNLYVLWLQKLVDEEAIDKADFALIKHLYLQDPNDIYLEYNYLYSYLITEDNINFRVERWCYDILDSIVNSNLDVKFINMLQFRFYMREYEDFLSYNNYKSKGIQKLNQAAKYISNATQAFEIADILGQSDEYELAISLLNRFTMEEFTENQVFKYISYCSFVPQTFATNKFEIISHRAFKLNPSLYCSLINQGEISLRVLENPNIKIDWCSQCNAKPGVN